MVSDRQGKFRIFSHHLTDTYGNIVLSPHTDKTVMLSRQKKAALITQGSVPTAWLVDPWAQKTEHMAGDSGFSVGPSAPDMRHLSSTSALPYL